MGTGTSSSSSGASAPRANACTVNRDASELRRSHARKAPASAQPNPMHVIYMSVRTGLGARTGARTATDGAGGSGYADRPPGFLPLTWRFRMPARYRHPVIAGLGTGLSVLDAEGVGLSACSHGPNSISSGACRRTSRQRSGPARPAGDPREPPGPGPPRGRRGGGHQDPRLPGFGDVAVGARDTAGDRDRLQHPSIVGDQEERARIGLEGAFELLDRGQVEMVGG